MEESWISYCIYEDDAQLDEKYRKLIEYDRWSEDEFVADEYAILGWSWSGEISSKGATSQRIAVNWKLWWSDLRKASCESIVI